MFVMLLGTMKKSQITKEFEFEDEEPISVEMDLDSSTFNKDESKNL